SLTSNHGGNGIIGIIHYNLAYSLFDTKGINETISPEPADKDAYQQNSLQAGIGIQAGKNVRIQPYFRYNKIDGDIDQGSFTDELDYTFTQKSYQAGVRNEFTFGKT